MKVLVLYSLTLSSIISIICLATGCSSQPFDNNPTISSSLFSSKTFARRTRNPPILASSRVPNRRLPTDETFPASFMEIRPGTVRFARVKPMLTSQNNNNFFSEINHERNRHQRNRHSRRRKRYSVRPEVSRRSPEDVCKSVSDWVLKVSILFGQMIRLSIEVNLTTTWNGLSRQKPWILMAMQFMSSKEFP